MRRRKFANLPTSKIRNRVEVHVLGRLGQAKTWGALAVFVDWSGISWRHYVPGRNYVPVTALRIVAGLSDGISRRQAFDSPPFGNDVLVASHDKHFGVRHHCKCVHAAVTGPTNPCEKCYRFGAFLPKRKYLIARNQETELQMRLVCLSGSTDCRGNAMIRRHCSSVSEVPTRTKPLVRRTLRAG